MDISCTEAAEYFHSDSFKKLLYYQAGMSSVACAFTILAFYCFSVRCVSKGILPHSIKLFLSLCLLTNAVESVFFAWIVFSTLFIYTTSSVSCEILQSDAYCNAIRIAQTWLLVLPSFLHASITFDRVRAFRSKNSDKGQEKFSAIFCFLSVILAAAAALFTFRHAEWDGTQPYCATLTPQTMKDTVIVSATMLLLELLSIIVTSVSYCHYRRKETKSYNVTKSYKQSENKNVFFLMLPWMLAHFFSFVVFYGLVLVIPMFFDWHSDMMELRVAIGYTNILPYYFLASPMLIVYILRRQKLRRVSTIRDLTSQPTSFKDYAENYGWI